MSKGGPRRWAPGPAPHEEEHSLAAPLYQARATTVPAAGGIFKSAAVEVLRRTRRLMPTGEICRLALDWRLLNCSGKTPEATMASAMYGDIKRKDRHSLFIRPQEGMFGLREWVDQGLLPAWQEPSASLAAASAAMSAPITVQPAKRVNTSSSACHQTPTPGNGGASSKAAGRAKRARRGRGCSDGDDGGWSDSDCSDQRCLSGDRNTLHSLRNGPVGRLHQGPTAAAPAAGPAAAAAPGAWSWQQQQQREEGMLPACLEPLDLPNLRPCSAEGTRLNTASGICRRSTSSTGVSLLSPPLYTVLQSPLIQAAPGTGAGGSCVASILSPGNSLADLRSPLMKLPFLASLGDTPGSLAGLLSPRAGAVASTGSQYHRSSGASHHQHRQAWSALKGAAAAAAAGAAGATASAVIAGSAAPGLSPDMPLPAMVPVCSSSVSAAVHGQHMPPGLDLLPIMPLNLCQQQQPHCRAGVAAGAAPPYGHSSLLVLPQPQSGAQAGPAAAKSAGAEIPEVVFRLLPQQDSDARLGGQGSVPVAVHGSSWAQLPSGAAQPVMPADGSRPGMATAAAAVHCHALGDDAQGGGAAAGTCTQPDSRGSAAAIAQKIVEVEGKVTAVEQKWGQLSLKTGKAYFLLYHACCHPQAAPLFRGKARQALQRACDILHHITQLGLPDSKGEECRSLLEGIEAAAASIRWAA